MDLYQILQKNEDCQTVLKKGEYLVILGDYKPLSSREEEVSYMSDLEHVCKLFKKVILVAGLKEYQNTIGKSIVQINDLFQKSYLKNLVYLDNTYFTDNDLVIYGGFPWNKDHNYDQVYSTTGKQISKEDLEDLRLSTIQHIQDCVDDCSRNKKKMILLLSDKIKLKFPEYVKIITI